MRFQTVILSGGCCLAFGAAFANAGLLLETGTSVSHLTGDISRISIDLARNSPEILPELLRVVAAALAFAMGALVSGLLIHQPDLDFARPYGRTVSGIGVLFLLSHVTEAASPIPAIALAAFACGIQNSLATRYRGMILRTTHLTGLITDFGTHFGMRLRGIRVPFWKIAVPGVLTAAFVLGGTSAALVFYRWKLDPVLLAGVAYLLAGILWTLAKHLVFRGFFSKGNLEGGKE
ncbi:MAG: DUF1275 domain-containing protein [Verrucomicrobiae bacterium]|nr:DUF1275 domain-containing protein [Verrucomicrobiae bacterium]